MIALSAGVETNKPHLKKKTKEAIAANKQTNKLKRNEKGKGELT